MQELWRNIRYGLRALVRRPVFALAILLSLILGIGTNTALYTLLDKILIQPLAVQKPGELLTVFQTLRDNGEYTGQRYLAYPNFLDYREKNTTLTGLAGFQWSFMNLTGVDNPQRITGMYATTNYFDLLGLQPEVGQFFTPDDDRSPVFTAVLGYSCWQRLFGGDPGIVGKKVDLNGQPFTILGVATPEFHGTLSSIVVDFWVPLSVFPLTSPYGQYFELRDVGLIGAFGRLKPESLAKDAEAELMRISLGLSEQYLNNDESMGITTVPLTESNFRPEQRESMEDYGLILGIAVGIVLLLSCLNVANLLLARARERRRELAIRLALGCSRGKIIRQLLVENMGIFLVGGLLSLPVAHYSLELLWSFRPPHIDSGAVELAIHGGVLLFALTISLLTGLIFGLVPALYSANPDLVTHLKEGDGPPEQAPRWRWSRPQNLLVVAQVALALVALICAGLFVQSLRNAQTLDLGFHHEDMAVATISPGEQGYDEPQTRELYRQLLDEVGSLPGVRSVTWASNRLLRGSTLQQQVFAEGNDKASVIGARAFHRTNIVVPGYFEKVGISLLQGEDFSSSIAADGPKVAIINQTMAEKVWPGKSAIGQRFSFHYAENEKYEIIGVVSDAVYREIGEPQQFFLYLPLEQMFSASGSLHVRTTGPPGEILPLIRTEVQRLDSNLVVADAQPLDFFVEEGLWLHRMSANLLSVFGLLALLLAVIGVYGVLSYSVAQRAPEIAIRMALGARRPHVTKTVLSEAMILVAIGWGAGLILAILVLKPRIQAYLLGVHPIDPSVYAVQSLLLILAAFLGTLLPVWKAIRTDPMRILRGT